MDHDHSHHNHSEHAGQHDKHAGHLTSDFLKKFWISLTLSVPIFFYSEMAKEVFNIRGPEFVGWQYALLLLGSVVYFYCGWVFLQSAYRELKDRLRVTKRSNQKRYNADKPDNYTPNMHYF